MCYTVECCVTWWELFGSIMGSVRLYGGVLEVHTEGVRLNGGVLGYMHGGLLGYMVESIGLYGG